MVSMPHTTHTISPDLQSIDSVTITLDRFTLNPRLFFQYQPLPRHSLPANQNIRPAAVQNGVQNGSMNGSQSMRNGGQTTGETETLKIRLQISNGAYQRMPK